MNCSKNKRKIYPLIKEDSFTLNTNNKINREERVKKLKKLQRTDTLYIFSINNDCIDDDCIDI